MEEIEELDFDLHQSDEIGLVHDSKRDCRTLMKVCNMLKDKINELVEQNNDLVEKYNELSERR
jgi:hypothetical protein